MSKITAMTIVLVSATSIPAIALILKESDPAYTSSRSANPEQETYAYPALVETGRLIRFVRPASNIGTVTGDPEKDTVAYHPLQLIQAKRPGQ